MIASVLQRFEGLHRRAGDVDRVVTTVRLGEHVTDTGRFENRSRRTTGDDTSTRRRRLQQHNRCAVTLGNFVRNGRAIQRYRDQGSSWRLDTLADRIGNFAGLAHTDPDPALAISDDD